MNFVGHWKSKINDPFRFPLRLFGFTSSNIIEKGSRLSFLSVERTGPSNFDKATILESKCQHPLFKLDSYCTLVIVVINFFLVACLPSFVRVLLKKTKQAKNENIDSIFLRFWKYPLNLHNDKKVFSRNFLIVFYFLVKYRRKF